MEQTKLFYLTVKNLIDFFGNFGDNVVAEAELRREDIRSKN